MKPSRIRGPRFVLAEYDGGEWPVRLVGMTRWEAWAAFQGRDLLDAAVIPVTPAQARELLAHPISRDMIRDETMTQARFARLAQVSRAFARQFVHAQTAKGSGRLAREARGTKLASGSNLVPRAPAGMADLLADALGAVLGPNAAVFRTRPREWTAIRAAAREIIEEQADAG